MSDRSDSLSDNPERDDSPADDRPSISREQSLGDAVTGADLTSMGRQQSLGEMPTGADVVSPAREKSLGDLETDLNAESSLSDLDDLVGEFEDTAEIVDLEARYEIGDSLGAGGMGEVRRAVDTRLKRPVAIKRLKDELEDSRRAMQRRDVTQADARSDLWSLAATLYQMLTGDVPRVIRLNRVPTPLQDVLGKALEENPSDRYQTAEKFQDALQQGIVDLIAGQRRSVGQLQQGECPHCETINETTRKFCRQCGGELGDVCLECNAEIKAWEQFCPECGTNLPKLFEDRVAEYDARKEKIESHRRQYQHAEAIELTVSLTELDHPRFKAYREWAVSEQDSLRQELQELEQSRDHLYQQAIRSFQEGGYDEALKLLEQIPDALRQDDVQTLLQTIERCRLDVTELLPEIRRAANAKQYDGLSNRTARYLQLKPRSQGVRKLHERLQRRMSAE